MILKKASQNINNDLIYFTVIKITYSSLLNNLNRVLLFIHYILLVKNLMKSNIIALLQDNISKKIIDISSYLYYCNQYYGIILNI